jgi:hypothetical protein
MYPPAADGVLSYWFYFDVFALFQIADDWTKGELNQTSAPNGYVNLFLFRSCCRRGGDRGGVWVGIGVQA